MKKECKKDCACKIEGKTHSFNDGCGCPKHNGEQFNEINYKLEPIKNMKSTLISPKGYKFKQADLSKMFKGKIIIYYEKINEI